MRFSTDLTIAGGESSLLINRVTYSCSVEFTSSAIPDTRRSVYHRLNDTWHADSAWHTFRRRRERGDPTDNARRLLYDQVLPALAEWLECDDARDLMRRGAAYRHVECYGLADAAERALSIALRQVQDLAGAVATGRTLTDEEEAFLRHPSVEPDRS